MVTPRKLSQIKKPLISVLIPFYNEKEVLPILFQRMNSFMDSMPEYDWEVVMVNDGSSDTGLLQVMQMHESDARWQFVDLSRNFGKEVAMMAGLDYVHGDCVVIMDADLQDPPELIPEMISWWLRGYDDVYATRRSRGSESWLRRRLSLSYYSMLQRTTKIPVLQNAGDFRLLDRICINALCSMPEVQRYTKGLFTWIGFRKKEITFDRADRAAGKTKWNLWKLMGLAIEGITSYTTVPLRISTFVGLGVSLAAFGFMMYYLIKTLLWGDAVQGFPTLVVLLLFLCGVILLSLGIMGEYIGRIFIETKRRPAFFVREASLKPRNK
ncbi:MAG: glycosyltransferase family 2 protein [Muribaculaceae bacterium]|nr:glycosyltransferase family 2 protein [Muribaculaceae bacterium]